ncbi:hypothetical protein HAX54_009012, partial [Datura stramonium]|nr:hypothetical protein [Datura stramonium]
MALYTITSNNPRYKEKPNLAGANSGEGYYVITFVSTLFITAGHNRLILEFWSSTKTTVGMLLIGYAPEHSALTSHRQLIITLGLG